MLRQETPKDKFLVVRQEVIKTEELYRTVEEKQAVRVLPRLIKEISPRTHVVVLTSYHDDEHILLAKQTRSLASHRRRLIQSHDRRSVVYQREDTQVARRQPPFQSAPRRLNSSRCLCMAWRNRPKRKVGFELVCFSKTLGSEVEIKNLASKSVCYLWSPLSNVWIISLTNTSVELLGKAG